ncbi:endonuclease/exonuclease/phosphatase family protein [Halarcobacter sp.]|uniref:endonuclease/exonuclease/phosphatase family protein n=1 Tax=Halarcobacter sp. TaxID=2321133 RepID=UPI002AAB9AC1|nr:endonuclease/exonuclease/phosphatase family protein [Halarcobacter sp.]
MTKLKVATFNLDKDNDIFPDRIYNLSNVIYKNRFDILCLQEDYNSKKFSTGKFLNIELNYNYISIKTREKFRNGINSSSNLTILSKYPIKLLDKLFFNKGKEDIERAAVFSQLSFKGKEILLINTHLCHLSSNNRIEQIRAILKKINEYKNFNTIIFCGDLNALPSYSEVKLLKEYGFSDKNSEFTHESKVILDYILNKSKRDISIESKVLLKGFSDHHCLLNIINFL